MGNALPENKRRGERLRDLRDELAATQRDVADATGLSDSGIRRWESGKPIERRSLRRLADHYGSPPGWIESGHGPRKVKAPPEPGQNGRVLERLDELQDAVTEAIEDLDVTLGGRLDGQRDQLVDLANRVRSLESRGEREPVKRPVAR